MVNHIRLAVLFAASLFATNAHAQGTGSFSELSRMLKVGEYVVVTDESGRETAGKLADLSPDALRIATRRFDAATVRSIRIRDSSWNGAVLGAALGGGLAIAAIAGTRGHSDAVYGWAYIGSWALPAAGLAAGFLIDRASPSKTVYQRAPAGGKTVSIAPAVMPRGLGLAMRF